MSKKGHVIAVCVSGRKGVSKRPVAVGRLAEEFGILGDAHAGTPQRQVSLLCLSSIEKMRAMGAEVGPGDFAENLTIDGCDSGDFRVGCVVRLERGPVLEVTQIGKECLSGCAILELLGRCVMPKEGIFARVVRGGEVRAGDWLEVTTHEDQSCASYRKRQDIGGTC